MLYLVAQFIADIDRVLADKGTTSEAIWQIGPLLQRLVAEGGDLTVQGTHSTNDAGIPGRVLHVDPDGRFRLVVARFAPGVPTPVHSHYRWGVECGISGRERFTVWTRVDGGSDPAGADLRVLSDHHIERGDLGYWYDPPRNIHRQWAEGSEPSCVLILLGGDGRRQHHFQPRD
jgi:predicted metal-dependent enzyme (double-stranded beta helix superfamily)